MMYGTNRFDDDVQEFAPDSRAFTPTACAAYFRDPDHDKPTAYSFKDGR